MFPPHPSYTSNSILATMSNSRKQEHPRTLAFRNYYGDDMLEVKLNDIYSNMTSENTSYFGDEADAFPQNIRTYRLTYELSNKIIALGILQYGVTEDFDKSQCNHSECDCRNPYDNFYDAGLNTFEEESPYRFFYWVANKSDESWNYKLHIYSSLQPIICHIMTEQEYNIYYEETYGLCYDCKGEIGYMSGQCADCYWEEDYERKHRRRSFYYNNPDLKSAWQSHCRHTLYPNEEIVVSEMLRNHIPKSIEVDSEAYNSYIQKFKVAIADGMMSVMSLLKEINPEYTPVSDEDNQMK